MPRYYTSKRGIFLTPDNKRGKDVTWVYQLIFPRSPHFLFILWLGRSQDSQRTHIATNHRATCKHWPGLTYVYPTTLLGHCCVPHIACTTDTNTERQGKVEFSKNLVSWGHFLVIRNKLWSSTNVILDMFWAPCNILKSIKIKTVHNPTLDGKWIGYILKNMMEFSLAD